MIEERKSKLLHTKLAASPKHPLLAGEHTRDNQISCILSPTTMAEMISNKNAATDYHSFFSGFFQAAREALKSEETERPLICMADCSPQLQSGMLLALSSGDGMASTRIKYGNIVLIHLLHCDKATPDIASASSGVDVTEPRKKVASDILTSLQRQIGVFLKECKSHVCHAPSDWVHRNKSSELAGMKPRFEGALRSAFDKATEESNMSVVVVQLSLLAAVLETEKFESPSFYDTAEMKGSRGHVEHAAEERMLRDVDSLIHAEPKNLHIQSLKDVHSRLNESDVKRSRILLCDGIVERAKALMKCSSFQLAMTL